ncbi:M20 metallopeptidase family protein [Bradyrhizobium liaoningense]|uniref:M20 metallopeptidase family protein n=1 Tax=Bradyrhizobium liaoningense TaxID=43992 RepID=UPI001BA96AFA|nr:amidohydrolase [Bradyrhizobium liaoningense]MBR0859140.1 amidohydrolase [Bradyrhizobium liaoningense]
MKLRYRLLALAAACLLTRSAVSQEASADPSVLTRQALAFADASEAQVIQWRRYVHQHAELSYQEVQTAAYIAAALAKMPGIEIQTGIAKTGIKAVLRGGQPGPVVALRADMDALPVEERNDLPFKSTARGEYLGKPTSIAHVCGHDTHVAMLLGAAQVLSTIRAELPGTVVFLFQPAEELGPGPLPSGASAMVEAGVLDNPRVDVVMGQHIGAASPSGTIGYRRGSLMASIDIFRISLKGKGGHGAMPWLSKDPTLAAAEITLALQNIASNQTNPLDGAIVVTVGQLQGGTRFNILPETAEIAGTIRSLSLENRKIAQESIRIKAQRIAESYGVTAETTIDSSSGYEVLVSDPAATEAVIQALEAATGPGKAKEIRPTMGSEDFGSFGRNIPVVFWILNASPFPDRAGAPNHAPEFTVDEGAMRVGVRALVGSALAYMSRSTSVPTSARSQ